MKKTPILLACVMATLALPTTAAARLPADAWEIGPIIRGKNYSVGMPLSPRQAPGGAVAFDFPIAGHGQIDAMTTPVGPLAGARQIIVRYRVDAAPRTRFIAYESPAQAATVSLYFQQRNDNWSGRGRYASYRWYAPVSGIVPLTRGVHTMTVRLDEAWTNVNGQPMLQAPGGFSAALRDTARIGLAFGSSSLRSHGVYASGAARFTLLGFDIE